MALNIKNPATHELALRLAARTGETVTEAVTQAVRERLERRSASDAQLRERLREISVECGRLWRDPSVDHGELLYDSKGMPK